MATLRLVSSSFPTEDEAPDASSATVAGVAERLAPSVEASPAELEP